MNLHFVAFVVLFSFVSGKLSSIRKSDLHNNLTDAVVDVLIKSFRQKTSHLQFVEFVYNKTKNAEILETLQDEIKKEIGAVFSVQVETQIKFQIENLKKGFNVIFIDSYEAFRLIFEQIGMTNFSFQKYFMIVMAIEVGDPITLCQRIFNDLWTKYIVNVDIVLKRQNDSKIALYTYFPFEKNNCELPIVKLLAEHQNDGKFNLSNYYPSKGLNFRGCPLILATANYPPFLVMNKSGSDSSDLGGIDGNIVKLLAETLNFKIILDRQKQRGVIFANKTSTFALGRTSKGLANFTIGYLRQTILLDTVMKPSVTYYCSQQVWLVPPGREYTTFEKLLKPFDNSIWLAIVLVILVLLLLVIVTNFKCASFRKFLFEGNSYNMGLDVIGVFFGESMRKIPCKKAVSFLVAVYVFYCLIFSSCYEGKLFFFLQSQFKHKNLDTVSEMLDDGFIFYIPAVAMGEAALVVPRER